MSWELIEKTISYVRQEMLGNDASHDWNHIDRVRKLAKFIAEKEGFSQSQQLEVELGALLHDIKDWKYSGDENASSEAAREFLSQNNVDPKVIKEVCYVVANIGFSKELSQEPGAYVSPVLAVVQDADRLDAVGAIGIARCLTYGGAKNRILYDPAIPPRDHLSESEYKYSQSTTMNHFAEKLFKLKSLMKTETGRQIAEQRQQFMENYVKQFELEWQGLDFLPFFKR